MPLNLSAAVEDLRRGRIDQAARHCEAALREYPDNPDALHLMGLVAIRRGDPREAVRLIGRAAALKPADAAFQANLGGAYRALGEVDQAIASCRRAIELAPHYPDAHYNLASMLLARGDIEAAISHLREAVRQQPSFAAAHHWLGQALRQNGDRAGSLAHYQIAVRLDPRWAERQSNLARALLEEGDHEQALVHGQEAVRLRPDLPVVLTNFANVLIVHGRLEEAKDQLIEAARLEPNVAAIHATLAHVYEQIGDMQRERLALDEALRCDPEDPRALTRLAARFKDKLTNDDQATIERVLANPGLADEPRCQLQFALAQALDAKGEFDRAAELSRKANGLLFADLKRRCRVYDPDEHQQFVGRIIATFTPDFFSRVRGFGVDTERPVYIVGLPRSGTSLTEQVLASHPRVFGAGELPLAHDLFESLPALTGRPGRSPVDCAGQLDRETAGRIARGYLDRLAAINDSADRIVDKLPDNTLYLGFVAVLFPRAKVIHCRRDPRDVALSCWMTNFARVRWAADPDQIARRIHEHQRLMEHWRRMLPIAMFEFDYETLVNDLEATARQLVAWCELEWDPACLEFHQTQRPVRSPSAAQVRQPLYGSSVGRWKNYEKSLAALFANLNVGQALA
jgi:tetratricopeptide (TPR) repeat protein